MERIIIRRLRRSYGDWTVQGGPVIRRPGREFPLSSECVLVAQVQILISFQVACSRIVEECAKIRRGHSFVAVTIQPLQCESSSADRDKSMLVAVIVRAAADSEIRGGTIELRKKQSGTVAGIKRIGQQELRPLVLRTITGTPLVGAETRRRQ